MSATTESPAATDARDRPSRWRYVIAPALIGLAVFWIWALFFASKEAVNRIDDRAWARRAETICSQAQEDREALADFRLLDGDDRAMLAERADVVDRATAIVAEMLDDVVSEQPSDAKGQEIVPLWEDDYRTYLEDRQAYTERLRDGDDVPFTETAVDGIPISDKLEVFAGDNEMPSCTPPRDL